MSVYGRPGYMIHLYPLAVQQQIVWSPWSHFLIILGQPLSIIHNRVRLFWGSLMGKTVGQTFPVEADTSSNTNTSKIYQESQVHKMKLLYLSDPLRCSLHQVFSHKICWPKISQEPISIPLFDMLSSKRNWRPAITHWAPNKY